MHRHLKYKKYEKVLKTAQELLPKFLQNIYKEYYNVNHAITSEDIDIFLSKFDNIEEFPFTSYDLRQFFVQIENLEVSEQTPVAEMCKSTYELYSTIFDGFRQYMEGDEE